MGFLRDLIIKKSEQINDLANQIYEMSKEIEALKLKNIHTVRKLNDLEYEVKKIKKNNTKGPGFLGHF